MPLIFINPVTRRMYDSAALQVFLRERGFSPVDCATDWVSEVRGKYKSCAARAERPIVDMRCPEAVAFVKGTFPGVPVEFPDIEPILVHCAKELADRFAKTHGIVITTPCRSLAAHGNGLRLKNTTFVAWNEFARREGCPLDGKHLDESPIPPGFFRSESGRVESASGKDRIAALFSQGAFSGAKIVELLACPGGCNNGDGVS